MSSYLLLALRHVVSAFYNLHTPKDSRVEALEHQLEVLQRDCLRWKRRALRRGWKPAQYWNGR